MISRILASGCVAVSVGCGNSTPPPEIPLEPGTGVVEVLVEGFRSDSGSALLALFVSSSGFPDEGEKAWARIEVPIQGGIARARFDKVPATKFAVGVLHDEDGDKKMKTGLLGRPKEGYGVSRDASGTFGPPSFGDAALEITDGQTINTTIRIRY